MTIKSWFVADFLLALMPFYWLAAPQSRTVGMPTVLVYFFATATFVAASIVSAYVVGRQAPAEHR